MLPKKFKNIRDEEAQGMVEFAIVFPILFFFFLAICQAAMLYTARQVVQYAAFAAVRSAIVWIPEEEDIDGTAFYYDSDFELSHRSLPDTVPPQKKFNKIEVSAALACISISPNIDIAVYSTFLSDFEALYYFDIVTNLGFGASRDYYSEAGIPSGSREPDILTHIYEQNYRFVSMQDLKNSATVDAMLTVLDSFLSYSELQGQGLRGKYVYSRFFTAVNFYEPGTNNVLDSNHAYEAGEDISAEVTHFYSMKVPVINKLIFMAYMTLYLPNKLAETMEAAGLSKSTISSTVKGLEKKMGEIMGRHNLSFYPIPIRARSTLTVEGDIDWS